ncbi:MAG TPA: hypothetical protein VGD75_06135, partial [Bradyrhizobium sp.]
MIRTIWFALSCLLGLSVVAGVRTIASRHQPTVAANLDLQRDSEAAPKSDRLDALPVTNDKIPVKTMKIAVSAASDSTVAIEPRHWRGTYAKERTRHHRHHRHR